MNKWRKLHRWIGLLIGIQVLLWIAGGVYMSAMPLEWVHGKHLVSPAVSVQQDDVEIQAQLDFGQYSALRWINRAGNPALEAITFDGEVHYLNPLSTTPTPLPRLQENTIEQLARQRYKGNGVVEKVNYTTVPPSEASGIAIPVYQVDFDDWCNTTFYVHPFSGDILKVRSDIWRLFDVFWMLHIMDYETRDNFNNPLLIGSAIIALFFTVSGMVLIITWIARSLRRRRALA